MEMHGSRIMKKLIIILFFLPQIIFAQIGITRPVAGLASTSQASTYSLGAFTPTAQSLLVVFVYVTGSVAAAPTMTNTGTTLTWTREARSAIGANMMVIFWARVPGTVSSSVITFDCTGDAGTGCRLTVLQFTGYDALTKNPIRQSKLSTATTTSTNPNITFNSALITTNGYGAAWAAGLGANVSTPPGSWTEADDLAYTTPSTNMAGAYRAGGHTTTGPHTFTAASSTWQIMGVEVWAAGAGPGTRDFFY